MINIMSLGLIVTLNLFAFPIGPPLATAYSNPLLLFLHILSVVLLFPHCCFIPYCCFILSPSSLFFYPLLMSPPLSSPPCASPEMRSWCQQQLAVFDFAALWWTCGSMVVCPYLCWVLQQYKTVLFVEHVAVNEADQVSWNLQKLEIKKTQMKTVCSSLTMFPLLHIF